MDLYKKYFKETGHEVRELPTYINKLQKKTRKIKINCGRIDMKEVIAALDTLDQKASFPVLIDYTLKEVIDNRKDGVKLRKVLEVEDKIHHEKSLSVLQNLLHVEGELIVSFLLEDILTCSVKENGWSSCYKPDGLYSLAPLGLAYEGQGVYYIKSKEPISYGGKEVDKKKIRGLIFTNKRNQYVVSGKTYPIWSPLLHEVIAEKIARALNKVIVCRNYLFNFTKVDCDSPIYCLDNYTSTLLSNSFEDNIEGTVFRLDKGYLCPKCHREIRGFDCNICTEREE